MRDRLADGPDLGKPLCLLTQGKTEPWRFTVLASHEARLSFYHLVQQVIIFAQAWSCIHSLYR